jgi:hypothetical protein
VLAHVLLLGRFNGGFRFEPTTLQLQRNSSQAADQINDNNNKLHAKVTLSRCRRSWAASSLYLVARASARLLACAEAVENVSHMPFSFAAGRAENGRGKPQ